MNWRATSRLVPQLAQRRGVVGKGRPLERRIAGDEERQDMPTCPQRPPSAFVGICRHSPSELNGEKVKTTTHGSPVTG